jgi:hypothetical protein
MHVFTILFIKLTMSKVVGSKVFRILQGNELAEYHEQFNVTFGQLVALSESYYMWPPYYKS